MANGDKKPEQSIDKNSEIPPMAGGAGEFTDIPTPAPAPPDVPIAEKEEASPAQPAQPTKASAVFSSDLRKEYKPRKRRRPILTLLAIFIVLSAIAALVYMAIRYKPPEVFTPSQALSLTNYKAEDIDSITVSPPAGEAYTIEYDAATASYRITGEDASVLYAQGALGDIYAGGLNIVASRTIDEAPEDISIFGLSQPTATVTLKHVNGQSFTFLIGDRTPTDDGWYVMAADQPAVYLVSAATGNRFTREKTQLRDLDILPTIEIAYADYVMLERPGKTTLELIQTDDDPSGHGWSFLSPVGAEVDIDALTQLCTDIASLDLRAYAGTAGEASDLAQYGLDTPQARVVLRDTKGGELRFTIGGSSSVGETYIQMEGSDDVYITNNRFIAYRNTASVASIASKRIASLLLNDIDSIRLTFPGEEHNLSIRRAQGEDTIYRIDSTTVDFAAANALYTAIVEPEIHGEVEGDINGAPSVTLRFTRNGGRPDVRIDLIPYKQDYYAISLDGNSPLLYTRVDEVNAILDALE